MNLKHKYQLHDVERVTEIFSAWLSQKEVDRKLTVTFDPGIITGRTTYQSLLKRAIQGELTYKVGRICPFR